MQQNPHNLLGVASYAIMCCSEIDREVGYTETVKDIPQSLLGVKSANNNDKTDLIKLKHGCKSAYPKTGCRLPRQTCVLVSVCVHVSKT